MANVMCVVGSCKESKFCVAIKSPPTEVRNTELVNEC